jgi:outer membrane protein assembly factor BamB
VLAAAALIAALPAAAAAQGLPPLPPTPGLPPGGNPPPGNNPPPSDNPPPPTQERPPTPGPGKGDVVSYRGNPQHTETAADDSVFGPLQHLWTVDLDAPPSQPLIVDGRVIVNVPHRNSQGGYGSAVVALDPATGKEVWRQPTPGTYFTSHIAIDAGAVVSVNHDGVVRAFAVADGRPLWTRELGSERASVRVNNAPVARGGTAFVYAGSSSSGQGTMHALDMASGAVRWSSFVQGVEADATPALDDRRAFVSDHCGNATALWQADGAVAWSRRQGNQCFGASASLLHDGRLFTNSDTGWVYDTATGADRGTRPGGAPDALAGDLGIERLPDGGAVRATDLGSGAIGWTHDEPGSYEFLLRPVVSAETVFAVTPKGNLVGLDRATGALRSSIAITGDHYSSIGGPKPGMSIGRGVIAATAGTLLHAYAPVLRPSEEGIDMAAAAFDVTYGKGTSLVGGLGSKLRAGGPRDVELEADSYPFGRYSRAATGRSFADGTAWFDARPPRNTRYRVRVPGGAAAKPLSIAVYPRSNWRYRRGRTRLELRLSLSAGSDFRVGGKQVAVYLFRDKGRHHSRLGSGRLVQTGRGRARVTMRFPYPRKVGDKDTTVFCIRGLRGYARADDPFQRRCGARVIKY